MTKADLIAKLAEETKLTKRQTGASLEGVITLITETLVKDGKLTLTGFGTFSVEKRTARTGRNPRTGKAIKIPASKVVRFRAGKALKAASQKAKI